MNTHFPVVPTRSAGRAKPVALPLWLAVAALSGLSAGGCVTETYKVTPGPGGRPIRRQIGTSAPPAEETVGGNTVRPASPRALPQPTGPQPTFIDQCPNRLGDICDALMTYDHVSGGQLPASLEDVRPAVTLEVALDFTCPDSHQPYVYNPTGLQSPKSGDRRLIVYDPTPAHHGRRWGIMWTPPKALGVNNQGLARMQPLTMVVVDLSEADFKTYTPVPAPTTAPAPVAGPAKPAQPAPPQPAVPVPAPPVPAPLGSQPQLQPEPQPQ